MDRFLEGKLALVTGGTRGIGRAVSEALLEAGAAVAICGQSAQGTERGVSEMATTHGGKIVGRTADVGDPESVAALFQFVDDQFGGLDILINNAGIGVFRPVADMTVEEWQRILRTNLDGAFYCAREAPEGVSAQ